jgi:hypothetical protein
VIEHPVCGNGFNVVTLLCLFRIPHEGGVYEVDVYDELFYATVMAQSLLTTR